MRSMTLLPALVTLALLQPLAGLAQLARAPADMQLGALRSLEPSEGLTDGGVRTMPRSQAVPVPMALTKDYRLGPNDLLDVEVLDADNLRRTVRVNAAGAISMPLIGHVVIAGLTSQEAEDRIASRYAEKYLQNPQVSIFIKEFTTERMTVEGAVARPGIFPLAGQMTLLRALAVAGGFGSIANTKEVMIYRTNDRQARESLVFDVEQIRAGKAADPAIRADDLIVVQRDSTRALLKDSLFRDVLDSINPFSVLVPH
jgi:polysaccharide export outer membrane protein